MYRDYENPYELTRQLNERKALYSKALAASEGWAPWDQRWDWLADLHADICDLEARVNFAWQDDDE